MSSGSSSRESEVKLEKSLKRSRETKMERDPYTLAMLGMIFVAMFYKSFIRLPYDVWYLWGKINQPANSDG